MKSFVGIDPGVDGGIASLDQDGKLAYTSPIPRIGKEVNLPELVERIKYVSNFVIAPSKDIIVILEDVHSIFGAGANSNFKFGWINGILEGMIVANSYRYVKVQPKTWQKECWQGIRPILINTGKQLKNGEPKYKTDTKATSELAVKRLFPNDSFLKSDKSTKNHNGLIDATLLAWYGYIKYK